MSWGIISDIIASFEKTPDTLQEFRQNFTLPHQKYLISKKFSEYQANLKEIPKTYMTRYLQSMNKIDVFPKAYEAIPRLAKENTLAILSQTPRMAVNAFLESRGLLGYFAKVYGLEDFASHKPSPLPVLNILDTLGYDKQDAMLAGDMVQDIQSARNADILSVAVSTENSYHTREALLKARPHHLISDLTELQYVADGCNHYQLSHIA